MDIEAAVIDALVQLGIEAQSLHTRAKQCTDLLDIVQLTLDNATRTTALDQLRHTEPGIANDVALHVDLRFNRRRQKSLKRIREAAGDITTDDIDLVAELLTEAARR